MPLLAPLFALLLASSPEVLALQTLDAADGVSTEAVLSNREATRVRVEGAPIVNVFGNIYSSNCRGDAEAKEIPVNEAGEVMLECDLDKGEVYLRPVGASTKPINLFISTARATYTLLLRRSDTPADTIVIRDRTTRRPIANSHDGKPSGRSPQHVQSLKTMLLTMASDRISSDVLVREVNQPLQLWQEATFVLTRTYEGRGLIGERYALTNVSNSDMVVAEPEFDREGAGVLGVSIARHNLRPGESTTVYIIRRGE